MKFYLILIFLSEKAHKKAGKLGGRPAAAAQIAPAAPAAAPQNGPRGLGAQQIAVIAAAVIGPEAVQPHGHAHGKQ